jgi:hypothetical protein
MQETNSFLSSLLIELELKLLESKSFLYNGLDEGLEYEYISELLETASIRIAGSEFYDLYKWKNGVKIIGEPIRKFWLFRLGIFFSLEYAVELYKGRAGEDEYWKHKMFPIFGSWGGEFYLMDLDPKSNTHGQIYFFDLVSTDFDAVITIYDSLPILIQTIIESYKRNAYSIHLNPDYKFVINWNLEQEISKELNPKSDFWKLF